MRAMSAFACAVSALNLGMWVASGCVVALVASLTNATVAVAALWMAWRLERPEFYGLFRLLRNLRVPLPVYYWLLDRLTDNNGWRPLGYREGWRR